MKKVAIIPLRKGSKSIKNKNKKRMLGRPLFSWVLTEAIFSNLDEIYIFTDDDEIIDFVDKEYSWTKKVKTIKRSNESATDTASTEYAMKEFSEKINHDYDLLMLLQATSPLTTREDINSAINLLIEKKYDSLISVVEIKRFFWDKKGKPINYDYNNRPRRQDFEGTLVENGAIYLTTKDQFMKSGIRIGGNIGIIKMPEETLYELDEPNDWVVIESLLKEKLKKNKKNISKIKAVVLDVDGIFTDAKVYYSSDGEFAKKFSVKDGMGISLLKESDIDVIVMTSEKSEIVRRRMEKLNIKNVYLGVKDKYALLEKITVENNLRRSEIAYLGDDINDCANMLSCGWGICPSDAVDEIKMTSDIILDKNGGKEFIREAIKFILKYNERF
jgi:N-acylneuraminate cytidylyltransferase